MYAMISDVRLRARGRRRAEPAARALHLRAFVRRRLPVSGTLRRDEGPRTSFSRAAA